MSCEDQEIVWQQEEKIWVDTVEKCVHVEYLWKPEVNQLSDNLKQVKPIQASIEKRIVKMGKIDDYNKELQKAINAGSIVKLSSEEIRSYSGSISYYTHLPVFKPDSTTTPLRIVFNGALKNANAGVSPNDCMYKGPNALNSLLQVLISWRSKKSPLGIRSI